MSDAIQTGYATADDGVQLYWRAVGQGPLMVCSNGVGVSTFFWKYLVEHFRDRYTVLLWDYRAHGRSARSLDPTTADLSVHRHAADLEAILAAVNPDNALGPAILVGHSMGCQVSLEHHRQHPERAAALVLMLGTAGRALDTFFDWSGSPRLFHLIHRLVFALGPAANEVMRPLLLSPLAWPVARSLALVDPLYTRPEDLLLYTRHMASIDARVFIESVIQLNQHNAWDLLPHIRCPVLVVAAENDTFTPLWCSRRIVAQTPGAELLILADGSHAALIEQPETINHRLGRFLAERVARSRPESAPGSAAAPYPPASG